MARAKLKTETDGRKLAVYVRKSKLTESGKSIEIQKEKCISIARAQFGAGDGDILVYEDEGKSGFYADRPQYKKMLRDIENDRVRAVICYKIDRISRRTVDLLNLVQQMEQKGISFVSVSDRELDTGTRTGKIMISLLSAIAEFERDIIAERVADNMYELAKEGRWLGGACPLGYRSEKETLAPGGRKTAVYRLEPIEEEQQAVRQLFELFFNTSSLARTAAALNGLGYKTKKRGAFSPAAVKNILQNPVYATADAEVKGYFAAHNVPVRDGGGAFDGIRGIMAYNKTEQTKELDRESRALDPRYARRTARRAMADWVVAVGRHRGIIIGENWVKAQNLLADIARGKSARPKGVSRALLSGLVRCQGCGGKMFVRPESGRRNPDGSPRYRYVCDAKYRKKGGCENSPNIKGQELDNFVLERICAMETGEKEFYDSLLNTKNALTAKAGEREAELASLKKQLSRIERDMRSQAASLRAAPGGAKEAIFSDIETLAREREEKQNRLDRIRRGIQPRAAKTDGTEKARRAVTDFLGLMRLADYESKLRLLRNIIECVAVEGGTAHIFLKGAAHGGLTEE